MFSLIGSVSTRFSVSGSVSHPFIYVTFSSGVTEAWLRVNCERSGRYLQEYTLNSATASLSSEFRRTETWRCSSRSHDPKKGFEDPFARGFDEVQLVGFNGVYRDGYFDSHARLWSYLQRERCVRRNINVGRTGSFMDSFVLIHGFFDFVVWTALSERTVGLWLVESRCFRHLCCRRLFSVHGYLDIYPERGRPAGRSAEGGLVQPCTSLD